MEVEHQHQDPVGGGHRGVSKFDPNLSPQHSVIEVSADQLAEDVLMRSLMTVERRVEPIRWGNLNEPYQEVELSMPL